METMPFCERFSREARDFSHERTSQKVKDNLLSSENNLRLANNKLDDLTIKRLTRGNKTMQQMFADTQAQAVLPESEKE